MANRISNFAQAETLIARAQKSRLVVEDKRSNGTVVSKAHCVMHTNCTELSFFAARAEKVCWVARSIAVITEYKAPSLYFLRDNFRSLVLASVKVASSDPF